MSLAESIPLAWAAAAMRGVYALPSPIRRALAGAPIRLDGQQLDTDSQLLLRLRNLGAPGGIMRDPAQARDTVRKGSILVAGPTVGGVQVTTVGIPGKDRETTARLYCPTSLPTGSPLLVYYHGGGWSVGDLDSHDNLCRLLATCAGIRVLSVDYRLAPEHPFPAGVTDAVNAFTYAVAEANSLGSDAKLTALGGDSAGGNLAIVAALLTSAGKQRPAFLLALYPGVDATVERRSRRLFGERFLLTGQQIDHYLDQYVPDLAIRSDPRVSPLLAEDLSLLPPTYVATAGFDPLRDEGEAFAQRVAQAGVPVVLRRHSGLIHGFANMIGVGRAPREAVVEAASALRTGLAISRNGRPRRKAIDPAELANYPLGDWLT